MHAGLAGSTQSQVLCEPQCGTNAECGAGTECDMYSEPSISNQGRNRQTVTSTATNQPSTTNLLHTITESQEYAQPHVTHTSRPIETAKNPAYTSTPTSQPIETTMNPAYGCTQPHVTEVNVIP